MRKTGKDLKMSDKDRVIGVQFHTKSPKYTNKTYYYKTNKQVEMGSTIYVEVPNNKKATVIVSNSNARGKNKANLKRY